MGSDVESVRPPRRLATDILVTSRQLTWLELIASLLNTNTNTNADANTYNSETPPQSLHLLNASTLPEAFSDVIAPVQEDTAISFGTETAVTRGLNYSSVTFEIKSTRQK